MKKIFNVNGACRPSPHYMVDLQSRIQSIKAMVDEGAYFTINRARQYGKTTTLHTLADCLKKDYQVISLDFQTMSALVFAREQSFVAAFAEELLDAAGEFPEGIEESLTAFAEGTARINSLQALFKVLKRWCELSAKKLVLMIDEVDTAANNQIFLDFLAQLRAYYLKRPETAAFHSVILAGVYDVRNMQQKIRPDEEHRVNSPWNIAADFDINMSFTPENIAGMLEEYEADHHTGMNIEAVSNQIYGATSGYPYLVSKLCKLTDEEISGTGAFSDLGKAWTRDGVMEAEKRLVNEDNPLFQSLTGKLADYLQLRSMVYALLFTGRPIPYVPHNRDIQVAAMLGFIRNEGGFAVIANRIFESVLYNLFISQEFTASRLYDVGERERNQFITGGHLNMRRVLERFVETFDDLYGDQDERFLEDAGRRYFMLFLKPIINGVGNSYVEPETRNRERMDLVIDYRGEQFIVELKVWRGNAYHERGEEQLLGIFGAFSSEERVYAQL